MRLRIARRELTSLHDRPGVLASTAVHSRPGKASLDLLFPPFTTILSCWATRDQAEFDNMEVPSHRACAHCRTQKVRCLPDESNPDICQRCARSGRPCVFTPIQKRKQRKRTDTRVAELEREMRAMRALLKEKSDGDDPEDCASVERKTSQEDVVGRGDKSRTHTHSQTSSSSTIRPQSELIVAGQTALRQNRQEDATIASTGKPDVVDRGILSMEVARRLVEHYKRNLYPQYPQVYIPCTADELRESRPTLFLAVLTAGAESEDPDLANALDHEVLQEYANRSVVNSEKSVELVQSLLVSAVWYLPPNKFGQLGKHGLFRELERELYADMSCSTFSQSWTACTKTGVLSQPELLTQSNPEILRIHPHGRDNGCRHWHYHEAFQVEPQQICRQKRRSESVDASLRRLRQSGSQHVCADHARERRYRKHRMQEDFPRMLCNLRGCLGQSASSSNDACHELHERMLGLSGEHALRRTLRSHTRCMDTSVDDW
jgi:hypothetical protein